MSLGPRVRGKKHCVCVCVFVSVTIEDCARLIISLVSRPAATFALRIIRPSLALHNTQHIANVWKFRYPCCVYHISMISRLSFAGALYSKHRNYKVKFPSPQRLSRYMSEVLLLCNKKYILQHWRGRV